MPPPSPAVADATRRRLRRRGTASGATQVGRRAAVAAALLVLALAQTAPARAEILIAAAGPMTGTYSRIGAQIRAGVEAAASAINAGGGILGEPLRVVIGDDVCERQRGVTVANALAAQGVRLVVGHACSQASAAASEVYVERRIVQISPAASAPAYTDARPGPGVFRLAGRDDRQGPILGAALAERFGSRRVAFLNDGTVYGNGLADAARLAFNAAGGTEVLERSFEPAARDYADLAAALRTARADVAFIGGYAEDAASIARALAAAGLAVTMVGGDALIDPQFATAAGAAADGTIFAAMPEPAADPANAELVARLRAAGTEPSGYTLYAYAAVEAWAAAARAADSTGYDAVSGALAIGQFPTVLGEVDFDETGDVALPAFVLYRWQGGRIEKITAPVP